MKKKQLIRKKKINKAPVVIKYSSFIYKSVNICEIYIMAPRGGLTTHGAPGQ
ncbi:unnamed protein product [Staurois parvus]|uniref:Uncharacterized protein n=1 Tax=Staurois parvus TaxID=386267 RepID=A0ABN9E319_9NEOB|nr:unnamed protein product [Staurois parvus]